LYYFFNNQSNNAIHPYSTIFLDKDIFPMYDL